MQCGYFTKSMNADPHTPNLEAREVATGMIYRKHYHAL